jgi:hypothetical protein
MINVRSDVADLLKILEIMIIFMALILIVATKSHEGQKLYVSGPITSKNGTKKIFLVAFVCLREQ